MIIYNLLVYSIYQHILYTNVNNMIGTMYTVTVFNIDIKIKNQILWNNFKE